MIGDYDVVSVLGRGGMGTVYRVRDQSGRQLALKLVEADKDSVLQQRRLEREFRCLARLSAFPTWCRSTITRSKAP